MNAMVLSSSATMTSREIADLVESRHDKVKQSIERLAERGVIALPPLGDVPFVDESGRNRTTSAYIFTAESKRDSFVVVAQLSPEFTARLVDRWQELEAEAAKPALSPANLTRLQLLEMAMQSEQERLALESKVAEIQPKAEAFDLIATGADGSMNITNAAKTLQINPKMLFQWLSGHKWIYRRAGGSGWVAYQDKLQQGLLEHKVTTVQREDGSEKITEQVRVTAKGLARLAEAFNANKGDAA